MKYNNRINGIYEFIIFQLENQDHIVISSLPWLSRCIVTVLSSLNDTMVYGTSCNCDGYFGIRKC